MSLKAFIRLLVAAIIVTAGVFAFPFLFRSEALVAPVLRDVAVDSAPGTVTVFAERTPEVRSEVGGRIEKSNLELARKVSAGEILVELDPTELQLQIKQIENDIAAAERSLEIGSSLQFDLEGAHDDLENKQELLKEKIIGSIEVQRADRVVRQLEQRIELQRADIDQRIATLKNTLDQSKYRLSRMKVVSPIDGIISDFSAGTGDLISPGTPIARLTSLNRYVEARISEENFAGVKIGQDATVRFLQYGGRLYSATVSKILPEADPQTQRYRVHLDAKIEPEKLVPGITGEASIVLDERPNALVVPRAAVLGQKIYVVEDGIVDLREVETGYVGLNLVEVLTGVEEGELVIVDELDRFRDGDRVRVVERRESMEEGSES